MATAEFLELRNIVLYRYHISRIQSQRELSLSRMDAAEPLS